MSTTPHVYILLPVHNRRKVTEKFIRCLLSQNYRNWHLVLIDDGSSDGTGDMARSLTDNLTILRGQGHWWWGGALQQGYKWIGRKNPLPDDVVLIANDDTAFGADFLANGVSVLKPRSLLLAQLHDMNGVFLEVGARWDWGRLTCVAVTDGAEINCFSTRGLFLRARDFLEIGGFHPHILPHYLSDYEFTLRAGRKGFSYQTSPDVFLRYDESLTGIRSVFGQSTFRALLMNLSIRSAGNPIYWTSFLLLACPGRSVAINVVRVWWGFVIPLRKKVGAFLGAVRRILRWTKGKIRALWATG